MVKFDLLKEINLRIRPMTPQDRKIIFDTLKAALEKCAPPMVVSKEGKDVFELIGNKALPYGSKKVMVPGYYFSSVIARKDMVSFYFMPLYYHEKDYEAIIPGMIKCLKGKTCFNFMKPEQINTKELGALLKKGLQAWKKSGYMQ